MITLLSLIALGLPAGLGTASAVVAASATAPIPVTAVAPARAGTRLVLVISGEAGRTDFEASLARELSAGGSGVLILDAKAYLSSAKTPARAAAEVEEAIRRYGKVWNRSRVVIVGNSRGADIAPFIANRLSQDLRAQVDGVVLLGPAGRASFELSLREAVSKRPRPTDLPVRPELERLRGTRLLCAYGRQESDSFCTRVDSSLVHVVMRPGGHKLAQADATDIAKLIQAEVGS